MKRFFFQYAVQNDNTLPYNTLHSLLMPESEFKTKLGKIRMKNTGYY